VHELANFEMPRLRALARRAIPSVLEGTLLPLALFYGALWLGSVWAGVVAALAWSWTALARRLFKKEAVPGLLIVGTLGITARSVIALSTGSVFVYFLQPTIGTVVVALAFLLSLPAGRPLAERLAHDFVALPDAFRSHPPIRRVFARITLLWAMVMLANAGITLWLLLSQSLAVFLAARTATSLVLTGAAIGISTVWFRRSVGIHQSAIVRAAP
jgi:hypothetical protein